MIKRLSLLTLCALAISGKMQAMHRGEHKLSLFGTTAHGLFRSTGKQDTRWWKTWWQLKPYREELARNPLALHEACEQGDLARVVVLLAAGANVNRKDNFNNWNPIHYASHKGHKAVAEQLINYGVPIEIKDNDGWTPLNFALFKGDKEIVELLIKHGARFDTQDRFGKTSLHYASRKRHEKIAEFLLFRSFFPPCSSQAVYAAQANLQELSLRALNNALNKHIVPRMAEDLLLDPHHSNFLQLIADNAPLNVQQALIAYWQQQATQAPDERVRATSKNKQHVLLNTHYNRHLKKIQKVLAIKDVNQKTARDIALEEKQKWPPHLIELVCPSTHIVTLSDQITQAEDFDQLPEEYKKSIMATIKDKLLLTPVKS